MSKFENPESENDFLADDDYLIGEDLRELESQLTADAKFLHTTYPSSSSNSERLAKLVNACVSASNRDAEDTHENEADRVVELNRKQETGSKQTPGSASKLNAWKNTVFWNVGLGNIGLGIIASACLVICLVWYLPQQSDYAGDGSIAKSVITIRGIDAGMVEVTPVSMSLPAEFLSATQPELEAIYDNMCPECDDIGDDLVQFQRVDF